MAGIRSSGTWGSALTAGEFAAIRSVGFEPVGQVFGAAVYSAGSASGYRCPGTRGSSGGRLPPRPVTQVSGRGGVGIVRPARADHGPGAAHSRRPDDHRVRRAWRARVVGVRLSRGSFPLGGPQCTVLGTAVRAPGAAHGQPVPFTCAVSGQDFAKLITAGWVPAGLVLGISIGSRHDDRKTARQARWGSGNAEVAGWTDLVNHSRQDARRQLEGDVSGSAPRA